MDIRSIRLNRKMSGTYVATQLGITPQYYYDIEKGKRNLSSDIALKLSEIFGVSVDYLLGRDLYKNEAPNFSINESTEDFSYSPVDLTVFSKRLSVELAKRNLTPEKVAEYCGRSVDFINSLLSKPIKLPSFDTLQKLSDIAGVTSDYLCGYTSDPKGYAQGVQGSDSIDLKEFVTKNRVLNYGGDKMELDEEEQAEIDDFLRVAWMTVKQKRREKANRGKINKNTSE